MFALRTWLWTVGQKKALAILEKFGLKDRADHLPSQLSVGEQRFALSRAICGAKIILADEPTGNLDSENAESVLQALKVFAQEGSIVLMVTRDIEQLPMRIKK